MALDRDKVTLSVTSARKRHRDRGSSRRLRLRRLEIGFNARYLLDILGQIEGDTSRSTSPTPPRRPCCARTTSRTRSTC
jgi:hypothetical protein